MNRPIIRSLIAVVALVFALAVVGQALSVCDYITPESRIADLGIQGSFNWYDGPYADDRSRTVSASLLADFIGLRTSASFAQALEARGEIRGIDGDWAANLNGSGSLRTFFADDVFGVGDLGFDLAGRTGLEIDLTAGVGTGRFRDVTPLAQAIQIQNELLDLGELLAPVADQTLLDLAQILGEVGPDDDEKVIRLVERLVATDLVPGNDLGVRGLLAVEGLLESSGETRLCGHDMQARVGVAANVLPVFDLAATGILLARYAAVPDPVSQFKASAEAKVRLADLDRTRIDSDLSYERRLPDGWTARADYRLLIDRQWSDPAETVIAHAFSGRLTTLIFGSVGLSLVGDAQYRTGDEEITLLISLLLEADLY